MTNDERAKNLRPDAFDMAPRESMLSSHFPTQNKPQLSLEFKGGVAQLVLSTCEKIEDIMKTTIGIKQIITSKRLMLTMPVTMRNRSGEMVYDFSARSEQKLGT